MDRPLTLTSLAAADIMKSGADARGKVDGEENVKEATWFWKIGALLLPLAGPGSRCFTWPMRDWCVCVGGGAWFLEDR